MWTDCMKGTKPLSDSRLFKARAYLNIQIFYTEAISHFFILERTLSLRPTTLSKAFNGGQFLSLSIQKLWQ